MWSSFPYDSCLYISSADPLFWFIFLSFFFFSIVIVTCLNAFWERWISEEIKKIIIHLLKIHWSNWKGGLLDRTPRVSHHLACLQATGITYVDGHFGVSSVSIQTDLKIYMAWKNFISIWLYMCKKGLKKFLESMRRLSLIVIAPWCPIFH